MRLVAALPRYSIPLQNYHNREDFLDTDEHRQTQIRKKSVFFSAGQCPMRLVAALPRYAIQKE